MVKRCPNCGAAITAIGEGDSVMCWYCNTPDLFLENEELKDNTLDLPDYDEVYQKESSN